MSASLRTASGPSTVFPGIHGLNPHDSKYGTPKEILIPSNHHREIPLEIVEQILDHLDFHCILECRSVCSAFRELIDSSPNLQYKMELARAGKEDGDLYPLATRRMMLEQHQKGWAELQWTNEHQTVSRTGGNQYELYGNVLAQDAPDRSAILFKRLQSKSRNIEGKDWSVDIGEYRMRDFGIDPAQDLLVIVEPPRWEWDDCNYRVFLRNLMTGEPHPSVKETSVLTHERQRRVDDTSPCRVHTCGDTLATLFGDRNAGDTEVVIWNWKTGQVLLTIIGGVITSMMFLSERHVMLGITQASIAPLESTLIIVDFVAESPGTRTLAELQNVFIFRFPPLKKRARIIYIKTRSYPSPAWKPASVPFFTACHYRLCVITLFVYMGMPTIKIINLFALGDVFLSPIKNLYRTPAYFDWQKWGPDGTRIIVFPFLGTFLYDVHGTRYACTMQPQARHVYIYDFNQLALKWAKKNGEIDAETDFVSESMEGGDDEGAEASMSSVNVTMPTTLKGGEIFQDDIETRLGYRVKRLSIPGEPRAVAVLCSEDGIVIVCGDSVEEYHALTV